MDIRGGMAQMRFQSHRRRPAWLQLRPKPMVRVLYRDLTLLQRQSSGGLLLLRPLCAACFAGGRQVMLNLQSNWT